SWPIKRCAQSKSWCASQKRSARSSRATPSTSAYRSPPGYEWRCVNGSPMNENYEIPAENSDAQLVLTLKNFEDEVALRRERKIQSHPGGLIPFVRYFWNVIEPETKLVEGWLLDAIAEHLEAITLGKITRLLINVPPGSMKSLMTQVFWP